MVYVLAAITLVCLYWFTRNVFTILFSLENYNIHRKRLKQLKFDKQKEETDVAELIDTVTKPIIRHVFSRFKPKDLGELEAELRMAKWDKYFTPIQYRALNLLLKAIGIAMFLLLSSQSMMIALIWFGVLFFGMDFLLKNSIKNRKEKLLADLPDFIRITEGYLSANMPFANAVSESIKYVGEEWKPILRKFVVDIELKGIDEALDNFKKEVDIFEVREFIALVKLALEQGGDAKSSFSAYADKIREIQMDLMEVKIGQRRTFGVLMQGPLLLCILLAFGLPTIGSMLNFNSM